MNLKYQIFISIVSGFIFFLNITTAFASLGIKSIFFNDSKQAQLLVNNEISSYPLKNNGSYNSFGYKVVTALSMLGIKTYSRDSEMIINEFRSKYDISYEGDSLHQEELLVLDNLVSGREQLNQHIIHYYDQKYDKLSIDVQNSSVLSKNYVAQVYLTLNYLPKNLTDYLNSVSIHYQDVGYNGYGGNGKIIIRGGYLIDNFKFRNVLLHELGHVIDTGMTGNSESGISAFRDNGKVIFNDDPNLNFLKLAWINDTTWRDEIKSADFVSTYASTNPFEDFAESYAMYVGNGFQFRCLAGRSDVIAKKYNYFKDKIFSGQEYFTGEKYCDYSKKISDVTDL